jgi:hypothetical protein
VIEPYLELRPSFARHETFHPRFGWLRKAVVRSSEYPDVFLRHDANVILGVGKNMVRAIRYWGTAFGLLVDVPNPAHSRLPHAAPSPLGMAMFSDDGWDPYLEEPASLWFLHWRLLRPPCLAPVWSLVFNKLASLDFSETDLIEFIRDVVAGSPSWGHVATSSIKKDVDCLLRMYTTRPKAHEGAEELLDAPFRQLGLLEPSPDSRSYRFPLTARPSLPDAMIAHATADFLALSRTPARTATIPWLAAAPGGPGRVFKLSEASLGEALSRYSSSPDAQLTIDSPAGVLQVALRAEAGATARQILERLFTEMTGITHSLVDPPEGGSGAFAGSRSPHSARVDPIPLFGLNTQPVRAGV